MYRGGGESCHHPVCHISTTKFIARCFLAAWKSWEKPKSFKNGSRKTLSISLYNGRLYKRTFSHINWRFVLFWHPKHYTHSHQRIMCKYTKKFVHSTLRKFSGTTSLCFWWLRHSKRRADTHTHTHRRAHTQTDRKKGCQCRFRNIRPLNGDALKRERKHAAMEGRLHIVWGLSLAMYTHTYTHM